MKSSPYFLMKDAHMLAEISYWRFLSSLPSTHSQKICRIFGWQGADCVKSYLLISYGSGFKTHNSYSVEQLSSCQRVLQKIILVLRRQFIVRKWNFSLYMWKKNNNSKSCTSVLLYLNHSKFIHAKRVLKMEISVGCNASLSPPQLTSMTI